MDPLLLSLSISLALFLTSKSLRARAYIATIPFFICAVTFAFVFSDFSFSTSDCFGQIVRSCAFARASFLMLPNSFCRAGFHYTGARINAKAAVKQSGGPAAVPNF